jgi:hypothetical protein
MALSPTGNPAFTPQAQIQRTKPDNIKRNSYQRFGYKSASKGPSALAGRTRRKVT